MLSRRRREARRRLHRRRYGVRNKRILRIWNRLSYRLLLAFSLLAFIQAFNDVFVQRSNHWPIFLLIGSGGLALLVWLVRREWRDWRHS